MENNSDYQQLCVWPGCVVIGANADVSNLTEEEEANIKKLVDWGMDTFGVRFKYEDEIFTNPDLDSNGQPVKDTGDRNDLFFYIHNEDILKFAVKRLSYGIRWFEDVVSSVNNGSHLYPKAIGEKYC